MKKTLILLSAIAILAIFLRFFRLGAVPSSLNWDEAAMGYDAYSILRTGKDQYGHFLPLTFQSLNDFKPPLYEYLLVPSVAIFGLTEFAVRLPSALFGCCSILFLFFLVYELFPKISYRRQLALLSSFLLAISPWHLFFSRVAFETNVATSLIIGGLATFLLAQRKKHFFPTSAIMFGLALFSYHSARLITPVLIVLLIGLNYQVRKSNRNFIAFLSIFATFFLITLVFTFNKNAQLRFLTINDFDSETTRVNSESIKTAEAAQGYFFSSKVFHNQKISFFTYGNLQKFIKNYFSHFSLSFWILGDNNPLRQPNFNLVYFWEPLAIYLGVYIFLKKYRAKNNLILFLATLLAPVPASTVWQAPSTVRAHFLVPFLTIFSALGSISAVRFAKFNFKYLDIVKLFSFFPLAVLMIYSIGSYLHNSLVHYNREKSQEWFLEKKEAAITTWKIHNRYHKVLVSNKKTDWPLVFFLFYTKYDPQTYLEKDKGTISGDFRANQKFANYEFIFFNQSNTPADGNFLIVAYPEELTDTQIDNSTKTFKPIQTIYYLNGEPAMKIVQNSYVEKID